MFPIFINIEFNIICTFKKEKDSHINSFAKIIDTSKRFNISKTIDITVQELRKDSRGMALIFFGEISTAKTSRDKRDPEKSIRSRILFH